MPSEGPIASAYIDILPQMDAAKFEQAIKGIDRTMVGVTERIDKAFDKGGASATKAAGKVKSFGNDGKAAGAKTKVGAEEAATGLRKVEHQLEKNISSIKKFEHQGEHAE